MSFMPIRGGPRVKECFECGMHELNVESYEKYKWLIEVDGRLVRHYLRHNEYERKMPLTIDMCTVQGSCKRCHDAMMILRNVEWCKDDLGKYQRHWELHKGHEKFAGWYREDWDFQEELRKAEFWFFEQMNRKHVVDRNWSWDMGGWEAVGRGCGGFEVVWSRRTDQPDMVEGFFGYPNNAEGEVEFPWKKELIG